MRKFLSMLLAFAMLFTVCSAGLAFPAAADVQYGVLFEGLPAEGETTVSQNGVEYTSSVATEDGCITLAPIAERLDTVLKFDANSSLNGTVTYSFYVTTGSPASQIVIGMNNLDLDGHRQVIIGSPAANTDYLIELVYDVNTAEYGIYVNGSKKENLSYSPTIADGVTDVALAAYAPQAGIVTINKVKVAYKAHPMTGYGTYFEGLPSEGLEKSENGVDFNVNIDTVGMGTAVNNDGIITLTTDGENKAIDTKLAYKANSATEGSVRYEFEIQTGDATPRAYVKYFTAGADTMGKELTSALPKGEKVTISFLYDPSSGLWTLSMNDIAQASGTASGGIDSVYLRIMNGSEGGEGVDLTNARLVRIAPPMTGAGTYFEGLPTEGFEKSENGVDLKVNVDTEGEGQITNNNGIITMQTENKWRAIDAKLTYSANSDTKGKVSYEFEVETDDAIPSVYVRCFTGGTDTMLKEITSSVLANSANTIALIYNPASAVYDISVNGTSVATGTAQAGIESVYIRVMSSTGEGESINLTNAKLVCMEPEVEGYNVYFDGLPTSGLTKTSNGVVYETKVDSEGSAVNNNGVVAMKTSGRYKAITSSLKFAANSSLTGTVTYQFDVKTAGVVPEFYVKYFYDGAEEMGSYVQVPSNSESAITFVYDTVSGEWAVKLDGEDVANDTVDSDIGIESVILICMSGTGNGESAELTNARVVYEEPAMTGYGTYLEGVPSAGLTKEQNGARFYINYENSGNAENKGGTIAMTTVGGWGKAVLPTLDFKADNTLNGIVTYEFTICVTGDLPQALYLRPNSDTDNYNMDLVSGSGDGYIPLFAGYSNPEELGSYIVLGEEYTFGIAYNTVTGDIWETYNGCAATNPSYNTSLEGSTRPKLNPATGLSHVAMAVFAKADSVITLKDIKIAYRPLDYEEPPMTGYGTYLEGVPSSGLAKEQNDASFYVNYENSGNAENKGGTIAMTTVGGWGKAVLPTLDFKADNTLNGIVTYEFTICVTGDLPQALYLRPNSDTDNYNMDLVSGTGDGYIPLLDGYSNPEELGSYIVLGEDYTFGIAYNTVTGDICETYNGCAATNPSYNTSLEGSTRPKLNPATGLSHVAMAVFAKADSVITLKNIKIAYHPFDNVGDITISGSETVESSIDITKAPYFSDIDSHARYVIAAYKGNKLAAISYSEEEIASGEGTYTNTLSLSGVDYDTVKVFLWGTDLSPIAMLTK